MPSPRANHSDQRGYVTDLTIDYLDQFDQLKGYWTWVNLRKNETKESKLRLNCGDGSKLVVRLSKLKHLNVHFGPSKQA